MQEEGAQAAAIMPVLFVGHGSPMNAIEDNEFSRGWREVGQDAADAQGHPLHLGPLGDVGHPGHRHGAAAHDPRFRRFPAARCSRRVSGARQPWLAARQTSEALRRPRSVGLDQIGAWTTAAGACCKQMFPGADVPVVQLSLDHGEAGAGPLRPGQGAGAAARPGRADPRQRQHGPQPAPGRVVTGNGVDDFNRPFGLDWAIEANDLFKKLIDENNHQALIDYRSLGPAVQLAVPTPEHYLPMLYALALKGEGESLTYFNDKPVGGSLTMTSLVIG